jgi:hypothetical protein
MKSDGTDQMNTVAKTAEYPFERLAPGRDGASLCMCDVFIIHIQRVAWSMNVTGDPLAFCVLPQKALIR